MVAWPCASSVEPNADQSMRRNRSSSLWPDIVAAISFMVGVITSREAARLPENAQQSCRARLLLDSGDELRRVDEAQRDDEPDQGRHHVHDGHRGDRLTGAHPGSEHRIIERADEGLAVRSGGQEGQL